MDKAAFPAPESLLHGYMNEERTEPAQQGFKNPGPTDDLRGVEANTDESKGSENPEQHGTTDTHDAREGAGPAVPPVRPFRVYEGTTP